MSETVLLKDLIEEAKKKYPLRNRSKHSSKPPKPTGFYNVKKIHCQECKQGFTYSYGFIDENEKKRFITRVSFIQLKRDVNARSLPWGIIDRSRALKTAREVGLPIYDLK